MLQLVKKYQNAGNITFLKPEYIIPGYEAINTIKNKITDEADALFTSAIGGNPDEVRFNNEAERNAIDDAYIDYNGNIKIKPTTGYPDILPSLGASTVLNFGGRGRPLIAKDPLSRLFVNVIDYIKKYGGSNVSQMLSNLKNTYLTNKKNDVFTNAEDLIRSHWISRGRKPTTETITSRLDDIYGIPVKEKPGSFKKKLVTSGLTQMEHDRGDYRVSRKLDAAIKTHKKIDGDGRAANGINYGQVLFNNYLSLLMGKYPEFKTPLNRLKIAMAKALTMMSEATSKELYELGKRNLADAKRRMRELVEAFKLKYYFK